MMPLFAWYAFMCHLTWLPKGFLLWASKPHVLVVYFFVLVLFLTPLALCVSLIGPAKVVRWRCFGPAVVRLILAKTLWEYLADQCTCFARRSDSLGDELSPSFMVELENYVESRLELKPREGVAWF